MINENKIANTSMDEASDAVLKAADFIQSNTEATLLGMAILIRMLEEKGAIDFSEIQLIADNVLEDLSNTALEKYQAINMYVDQEF